MATKIQVRRDTAANWTSANTVLSAGEMGWESDTGYMKIGDGTTAWSSLSYFTPSGADANTTYTVGAAQNAANADITLAGSDASTDTLSLVAGSNLTLAVAGDNITVNALDSQYAITTETGGIIRLTASGNATGTDDITIAGGTGISVADGSDTLTVNLDAAFNDLSDVNVPSPGSYDHLQWDGSNWVSEAVYFYSTKRFSGGLATDRFIELQNRVITIGSISSGDVVDFPTNFSGGSNYGIEWQVNNPETDFVANLTPGPVNINTSTYFRIIIDNTNSALTDKGYISGLQRNGAAQTVNWTNTIDGSAPNVSGADVYDIYEFYCFRGNGGSDETWYGTLLTGASGTLASLSDVDVLANSGNPTPINGSFLQYDSTDQKWNASSRFERSTNFQQGASASRLGFQEVVYWDETKYTGSNGDTLTLDLDTDISNRVGNSGRFFIETIDHNFVADFQNAVHPEELAQVNETIGLHNKFMIVVDNNVRNETRLDTVYAPSGVADGETIIINGTTVTQTSAAISAGPHGFSDLITAAGISGVSAWYHREGNYRILSETVGSTETGLQIGAGTANATLGISEGNYGSEEYGSPGVGLVGVKINGRTVRTVWSSGSAPVAKAGRYEVYEIDYFPDSGHGNPNEYVFVRHHNTDSLDGDLDLNNQNITGTGNINILGNYQIEKAVSGTGETFGSILAKTATTEYNKIDFKTGPDAFADNGEVTWSTRVQGALTQIFEIKGSSVGKSGIAVNPNSNAEVDFLVSGSGDATLFVVDAGDDNVGIGKYPTQGKLDVDGDVYADNLNGTVVATFNLGASGTDHYVFSDSDNHWFPTSENDPTLYLRRGETYVFNNTSGSHPFQIQSVAGAGGAAYSTGVTNNNTVGVVTFKVPMSAPATLYYQCTSHANMGGTMNII